MVLQVRFKTQLMFITTFGDYPVTLTVTNSNGCENSATINTIEVQPVVAQMVDDNIEGCAPMTINSRRKFI